jgi:hypothetical protein
VFELKLRLLLVVLPLLIAVSGCSHLAISKQTENGIFPSGLVWNHRFYGTANGINISKIGRQLGEVTRFVNHRLSTNNNGSESNVKAFGAGTKIYAVPNKDASQAIAIQLSNGRYVELPEDHQDVTGQ